MKKNITSGKLAVAGLVLILSAVTAHAEKTELVAVSADVVEISGSFQSNVGFAWNQIVEFTEASAPGILTIDQFERKTLLNTTLKLMRNEGKAQTISNPKVIAKSGANASFSVGGERPIPVAGGPNTNGGADYKKFGVFLEVVPVILAEKKDAVDVQLRLEVSNPDYSRTVSIGNTTVPSMVSRYMQTEIELKSGDTLVIGGLKSSHRNVNKYSVPLLGKLPLIGKLFSWTETTDEQRSLFLFITVEIVK
ncbi:MAG: type II and III secretion system protein [Elusimicrobia bacterium]|nr:type II and III secretion system protein [Elusimicrobiota bacterium]